MFQHLMPGLVVERLLALEQLQFEIVDGEIVEIEKTGGHEAVEELPVQFEQRLPVLQIADFAIVLLPGAGNGMTGQFLGTEPGSGQRLEIGRSELLLALIEECLDTQALAAVGLEHRQGGGDVIVLVGWH